MLIPLAIHSSGSSSLIHATCTRQKNLMIYSTDVIIPFEYLNMFLFCSATLHKNIISAFGRY